MKAIIEIPIAEIIMIIMRIKSANGKIDGRSIYTHIEWAFISI